MGHLPQLRILEAFRVSVDTAAGAAQPAIMSRLRPFGLFIFPDEILSRYQRIHHIPRQIPESVVDSCRIRRRKVQKSTSNFRIKILWWIFALRKALTPGLVGVSALTLFDVLLLDISVYINNVCADEPLEFLQLRGLADVDVFSYWIHWTG